jgi:hypothetical protein
MAATPVSLPSNTASTDPSELFLTQPATSRRRASSRQLSRNQTPCTRPDTTTRFLITTNAYHRLCASPRAHTRHMLDAPDLAGSINERLAASAGDTADITVDTDLRYTPGEPVRVRIRHRDHRYDIDDDGAAVRLAGKPPGWLDRAEQLVALEGLNVNRRGVVSVPAVEGRDIGALAAKIARCSHAVYCALLDLTDEY